MIAIELANVSKSFGEVKAVSDVSFCVQHGQIFGLLGPNGAGKTTIMRMIMDIIKPDSGQIYIFGEKINDRIKNRLGYLPEERGLYQRRRVIEVLELVGQLKGIDIKTAKQMALKYLEIAEMLDVKNRKIMSLSKGMQQKIQFIMSIFFEPDIAILDEPYWGLDPINRQFVVELMKKFAKMGKTIVLSTHLMNMAEELCTNILLINKGKAVLYGNVQQIKQDFYDNTVLVETDYEIKENNLVIKSIPQDQNPSLKKVTLLKTCTPEKFLEFLIQHNANIRHFERVLPSLDEIFIKVVGGITLS